MISKKEFCEKLYEAYIKFSEAIRAALDKNTEVIVVGEKHTDPLHGKLEKYICEKWKPNCVLLEGPKDKDNDRNKIIEKYEEIQRFFEEFKIINFFKKVKNYIGEDQKNCKKETEEFLKEFNKKYNTKLSPNSIPFVDLYGDFENLINFNRELEKYLLEEKYKHVDDLKKVGLLKLINEYSNSEEHQKILPIYVKLPLFEYIKKNKVKVEHIDSKELIKKHLNEYRVKMNYENEFYKKTENENNISEKPNLIEGHLTKIIDIYLKLEGISGEREKYMAEQIAKKVEEVNNKRLVVICGKSHAEKIAKYLKEKNIKTRCIELESFYHDALELIHRSITYENYLLSS